MKRKKEIGIRLYITLLTIVATISILLSASIDKIHATEESMSDKTDIVEESIFASGNHGIDWRLTTDGVLYLGEGTMNKMEGPYGNNYPWMQTGGTIKKVVIEGNIILPEFPKLFMSMRELQTIENIHYLDT